MKVANLRDDIKKALGKRYAELRNALTNVKRDARAFASIEEDWQKLILKKYPVLTTHSDLLNHIDPYPIASDADASERILSPWEIAIEVAARETIPNYEHYSVSADALKQAATLPNKA